MNMRRHIMLVEQYRLMSLLLESRESAIFDKFTPLIAKMRIGSLDLNAIQNSDVVDDRLKSLLVDGASVDKDMLAHGIITMVWAADSNPKKAYTTWLLTRYVAGNIKLEDLDRIKSYLEIYERVKLRLPVELRDINRFKSPNDLFDVVKDFREENGEIVTASQEKQMLEQSEVIYNGSDYLILSPKTQESSCYFGRGTEWCTAYVPPKTNNQFNSYNDQGPLYIVVDKSNGEKWQFHRETESYMDKNDRHIDIKSWKKQHPKVDAIFTKYFGTRDWSMTEDEAIDLLLAGKLPDGGILKNRTELSLHNNQITDISSLAALTNLEYLGLHNNQITDISPLASLTNLKELYLYGNQITDISSLAALTNLEYLGLHNNQITDISPLASLTNLKELYLDHNQITDISSLAALTNLKYLHLYDNQITDISPLASLTNLKWINLNNNQITDISPLASLTKLKELYMHGNKITDISPLASLTNLKYLYLQNNQITYISPLASLINLKKLCLYTNQITDISSLAALTNLKELDLDNNPIKKSSIEKLKYDLPSTEITS